MTPKSICASFAILLFYIGLTTVSGASASSGFDVYPSDSSPNGTEYGEWTGRWWDWFIGMPDDVDHPLNDRTGEQCNRNQEYLPSVWFGIGGSTVPVERSCNIPEGAEILIPIIINECSTAEDPTLITEDQLRACAEDNANFFTNMAVTIDGVPLQNIDEYYIVSPMFNTTFPEVNPMFTAHPGSTNAVSAGYWLFLNPLSPGEHELHIQGASVDPTVFSTRNFAQDFTYHLTIPTEE